MTEPAHIEAVITELLGPNAVLKAEDGKEYLEDINGPGSGSCLLIVKPATTQELAALMALCQEHGIGVIPQGGNTNVCRMAIPTEDRQTILVSLKRMNRIIEIDQTNATVTVEAGCLMQVLQEAVAEKGMLFAPDWGARGSATVGGAVSTNGGGLNVLRYGTTREQVLVWRWSCRTAGSGTV